LPDFNFKNPHFYLTGYVHGTIWGIILAG